MFGIVGGAIFLGLGLVFLVEAVAASLDRRGANRKGNRRGTARTVRLLVIDGGEVKRAARDFKLWKMCGRKHAYDSAEEAFQKGQQVYQCTHCAKWHRSGSLATLVSQLRRTR